MRHLDFPLMFAALVLAAFPLCSQGQGPVAPAAVRPCELGKIEMFLSGWMQGRRDYPGGFGLACREIGAGAAIEDLVYLSGGGWCGSSGCTLLVLAPVSEGFILIGRIPGLQLPIRVLPAKSHGRHDLVAVIAGGGVLRAYDITLRYDGVRYPVGSNLPAMPAGAVLGEIVLSSATPAHPEGQRPAGGGGGGRSAITWAPANSRPAQPRATLRCSQGLDEANETYASVQRAAAAWPTLQAAGAAQGVSPALLAAIGIRESGFVDANQIGGAGVGVFALAVTPASGITAAQANTLLWAAIEAARELAGDQRYVDRHFPWFTAQEKLEAAAALYNFGPGRHDRNITANPATIDGGATGGNYGSDVWEMMSCFDYETLSANEVP